ncbi:hypothetical protein M3Y14_34225 (plasmid) [Bacillus thuringiensis]|uniref:hypothetical protein n=1 Tax=Bacillus thuringiensis TaxID=1428 RepID=UPI002224819A|nr:hypothetical protein [Bacillus thuringiensis]UYX56040.1 hypothetical protein M3Y14_34225 [Bacillus thuringiensis]
MGWNLQPAYEKLDEKALLCLLTDCLNRAKDGSTGNTYTYKQLEQAEQIVQTLGSKITESQATVI